MVDPWLDIGDGAHIRLDSVWGFYPIAYADPEHAAVAGEAKHAEPVQTVIWPIRGRLLWTSSMSTADLIKRMGGIARAFADAGRGVYLAKCDIVGLSQFAAADVRITGQFAWAREPITLVTASGGRYDVAYWPPEVMRADWLSFD